MLETATIMHDDPAVAALAACLDPGTVLEATRQGLTRMPVSRREQWKEARQIEALYHPGRYVRVVYAMLGDETTPTSRAWPEEEIVSLHAPVRRPMSGRGEVLWIDGQEVEAYCFPNDRRLRGLRTFARRDLTLASWRTWSPGAELDEDTLQRKLVRYVPEQKFVVRLRGEWIEPDGKAEARRVAVRCSSPSTCKVLQGRHSALAHLCENAATVFRVPNVIGYEDRRGLLAVEWLRGQSLVELLHQGSETEALNLVARSIRQLHGMRVEGLVERSSSELDASVHDALSDLALQLPDLEADIRRLQVELPKRLLASGPTQAVTLHNDLHPDQFTFKRGRLAIFDLERMAIGCPEMDIANMAIQLEMLGRRPDRDVDPVSANRWQAMFLDCWRKAGGTMSPVRFHLLCAVKRIELARGMLRHVRPWWMPFATECLGIAGEDLHRAELAGKGG